MRLLHRLRLEDRVLDVKILAVKGRPPLGPHPEDQLHRFFHLPDTCRGPRRELPTVLRVFVLEESGTDAERESSAADQIDARRDLGEMSGIAVADHRRQRCETD